MTGIRRRAVVSAGVAALGLTLAGCTGSTSGDRNGGDTGDGEEGGRSREEIIDDRIEVEEDGYRYVSFDLRRDAELHYEYTVREGPAIEVFVVTDDEFDEFQAGNRFRGYSASGVGGGDSVSLPADSYRFVVDNTNAGDVRPPSNLDDDIVVVEVTATVVA